MKKKGFCILLILALMACTFALGETVSATVTNPPELTEEEQARLNALVTEKTTEWEKELGYHGFWPLEKKVEFYQAFGTQPTYYYANTWPILMPESQHMPQERAIELSDALVKERYELTDENLQAYTIGVEFIPMTNDKGEINERRQWIIRYYAPCVDNEGGYRGYFNTFISYPENDIVVIRDPGPTMLKSWGMGEYAASMLTEVGMVYYNPEGGQYYHIDNTCSCMSPEYYDDLVGFETGLLPTSMYKHLKPCPICLEEPSPEDMPSNG